MYVCVIPAPIPFTVWGVPRLVYNKHDQLYTGITEGKVNNSTLVSLV